MTTIAVPDTRPVIVCPDWCTVTYEEHVRELRELEGFAIHWSADGLVRHSRAAFVDNTVDPEDPPRVYVDGAADGISLDDAETLARTILAAVEEARS